MNQLTRVQHKYKISGDDFNKKVTNKRCEKEHPLMMTFVSIGLATTLLTPVIISIVR